MKKLVLAGLAALTLASPAIAMTYYLKRQWHSGGNQYCEYSNGTILNVGARLCPMSIQG